MNDGVPGGRSGASWHGVELRHLAALRAVGAERSFRGAAERLGYVQSAVSQQISQFEGLVGERLIERERGHAAVALTAAGEVLLAHAEEVLSQLAAARSDLAALTEGEAATLRVGATQCVAARVLPRALALLYERRPGLRVEVSERSCDSDFFERLTSGELDLAFCELPAPQGPYAVFELFKDPCVLVIAAGQNGSRPSEPVSLKDAAAMPLVGRSGWRFWELVEAQFRARGLEPRYAAQAETDSATQALVASGRAAAIMSRLAVSAADHQTEVLELDPELSARTLALVSHRERRHAEALDAFREAALDGCAELFSDAMASGRGRRRAEERGRFRATVEEPVAAVSAPSS